MIVFELICNGQHRFEGWFASGNDFDAQKARGLIACPQCGTGSVEKLPTARIRTTDAAPAPTPNVPAPKAEGKAPTLNDLIDFVLKNTEDVGGRFAEEARRIHAEEAPQRAIRGTATGEQTRELIEEGIPVLPLPIPPRDKLQ